MKRLLLAYGFKLFESKSPSGLTNIKLTYVWTREEMRKAKNEKHVLSSERLKFSSINDYEQSGSSPTKSSTTGSKYKDRLTSNFSSKSSFMSALNLGSLSSEIHTNGIKSPSVASSLTYDGGDIKSKHSISFLKVYSQLSAEKNKNTDGAQRSVKNSSQSILSSNNHNKTQKGSILPKIGQSLISLTKIDVEPKLKDYNYYEARERMNSFKQNRSLVHIKSKSYDENSNFKARHNSQFSIKDPMSSKIEDFNYKLTQVGINRTEQKIKIPKFTPQIIKKKGKLISKEYDRHAKVLKERQRMLDDSLNKLSFDPEKIRRAIQ